MKYSHILEPITTKYLVITVLAITVFITTGFTMILSYSSINIDTLPKFVDSVFKTVAVLVAAVWSLNRYYASRADVNQLRVDADVTVVRDMELA